MRAVLDGTDGGATVGRGRCAATNLVDGKSAADDGDWFSEAAQQLHPHKPGTVLFLTTELGDERLCQRYAAGHVKPPAYFFRALLRSDQGWQWLCAAMEGSDAEWWREMKRARARSAAIDAADNELSRA